MVRSVRRAHGRLPADLLTLTFQVVGEILVYKLAAPLLVGSCAEKLFARARNHIRPVDPLGRQR